LEAHNRFFVDDAISFSADFNLYKTICNYLIDEIRTDDYRVPGLALRNSAFINGIFILSFINHVRIDRDEIVNKVSTIFMNIPT